MTSVASCSTSEVTRRPGSSLSGNVSAIANLQQFLATLAYTGSGSINTDVEYASSLSRIASSPCVVIRRSSRASVSRDSIESHDILTRPIVDQMQELQETLSLNKSQLAQILHITRPTLYGWLRGNEPNRANAERLGTLLSCLKQAQVSSTDPLNARFVRHSMNREGKSLLELLTEEDVNTSRVVRTIKWVHTLEVSAERERADRELRLRELGFEAVGSQQRREQLARNVALRAWPNG